VNVTSTGSRAELGTAWRAERSQASIAAGDARLGHGDLGRGAERRGCKADRGKRNNGAKRGRRAHARSVNQPCPAANGPAPLISGVPTSGTGRTAPAGLAEGSGRCYRRRMRASPGDRRLQPGRRRLLKVLATLRLAPVAWLGAAAAAPAVGILLAGAPRRSGLAGRVALEGAGRGRRRLARSPSSRRSPTAWPPRRRRPARNASPRRPIPTS
jgi:hypothetical protein